MTPPRRPGAAGGRRPRAGTSPSTARAGGGAGRPPRPVRKPPPPQETLARRRSGLTGRAAVLALVLCALALALAYPLREFLAQRGDIAELRDRKAAQERRVAALQEQKELWHDPAYVRAQARERLHYVMPGETAYVVLDPRKTPAQAHSDAPAAVPPRPWYSDLWASVEAADGPRR